MAIGVAMYHFTGLSPEADFAWFAWARAFQMAALPFLFLTITSFSYVGLPPGKSGQASALINVARNLGGSIGVSATQTLLARREQFHQARLAEHFSPSSLAYGQTLKLAAANFARHGAGAAERATPGDCLDGPDADEPGGASILYRRLRLPLPICIAPCAGRFSSAAGRLAVASAVGGFCSLRRASATSFGRLCSGVRNAFPQLQKRRPNPENQSAVPFAGEARAPPNHRVSTRNLAYPPGARPIAVSLTCGGDVNLAATGEVR